MVRSSHHLPLPSLPPPRVVLCFVSLLPRRRESSKESLGSGAVVSPHRIYRADPQRAYQYVNESPTGTTVIPLVLHPSVYIDTISGDRYLACRPHFFSSPPHPNVPPSCFLFGCNPDEPYAPSRHSNYEFDTDALCRVSRFLKHTYCLPRECICWLISPHHKTQQ